MKPPNLLLLLYSLSLGTAPAFADEIQDCLRESGIVAPHAEELARQIQDTLAKDGFLHRAFLSPTEMRMHSNRKLAEMLVARLDAECEQPRTPAASEAVDSEIVMMVPQQHLASIAKLGFQNQHMTATTSGCACAAERFRQEQSMITMHMPYSNKARDLLPKYSAFNLKTEGMGRFSLPSMYGNFALVMKPEVKKRTTFTFTDSLGMGLAHGEEHFPPRTPNYRKPTDGRKIPNCAGYCEAQIWGPLDLGDVDHIMVPKGTVVTEDMKMLGVPIFEFESPEYNGYPAYYGMPEKKPDPVVGQTAQYRKGEMIFAGSAVRAPDPASQSRKELEKSRASATSPALKNIFESKLLEKMPDKELLQKYRSESNRESQIVKKANMGNLKDWPDYLKNGALPPSEKIFTELASRSLTPEIEKLLREGLKNESVLIRHQALLGLSGLPAEKLKPLIVNALGDQMNLVKSLAISMAADFPNDKDLSEKVRKSLVPDPYRPSFGMNVDLRPFAARLAQQKFCNPIAAASSSSRAEEKSEAPGWPGLKVFPPMESKGSVEEVTPMLSPTPGKL